MGLVFGKPTFNPDTDIPDLTGKVALVTGGNTGLGYQIVAQLVRHHAKVYMGARNEGRAKAAVERLHAEGALGKGVGTVEWLPLDLMDLVGVKAAAEQLMGLEERLDILVHNAGLMGHVDTFEMVGPLPVSAIMLTNHLGPFLLTKTLMPLLKTTADQPGSDVRVVTLSSSGHNDTTMKMNWKSADQWLIQSTGPSQGYQAYGMTKVANILFAKELQVKFDEQNIAATSITLHPGSVPTSGLVQVLRKFALGFIIVPIISYLGITEAQGAYTPLFAATSPLVKADRRKYGGAYLWPWGRIEQPSKAARDPVAARDLWETSERMLSFSD